MRMRLDCGWAWPLLAATSLVGCGSSDGSTAGNGGNGGAVGGESGVQDQDWVVQTVVQDPSGRTAFMHLVDSPGTEPLELAEAREVGGNARLYILEEVAFIGDPESRTIVRTRPGDVTLEDDSDRVSFAETGLSFLPSLAVWVSDDEAFLLDGVGGNAYGWSPTDMTLGRRIDLTAIRKGGFNEPTIETAVVRNGKIFFVVQQVNALTFDAFQGVQMGIIDVERGALETTIEDTRCIGTRSQLGLAEDGTIYVQADNYGAVQYIDENAPATCILRILPDEEDYDPSWKLDMPDLCEGREAAQFIYAGNGLAYVSVVYEEEFEVEFVDNPLGFFNQPASRWWLIDLVNETGTEVADMPFHSIGGGNGVRSDGRVFLFSPTNRFEGTTPVWEVDPASPAGAPTQVFEAVGAVPTLGRVTN